MGSVPCFGCCFGLKTLPKVLSQYNFDLLAPSRCVQPQLLSCWALGQFTNLKPALQNKFLLEKLLKKPLKMFIFLNKVEDLLPLQIDTILY